MTRKPGKPAVASWAADRIDVFVRTAGQALLHTWFEGDNSGASILEGAITTDPVAMAHGVNLLSVFAGSTSQSLLRWRWDVDELRMVGPEDWGRLVTPPVPISWRPGQVDVLARSVDVRALRRWLWSQRADLMGPLTMDVGSGRDPVPVSHAPNKLDVFFWNGELEHREWDGTTLVFRQLLGGRLISDPIAVSWAANRIDVFARTDDGLLTHWGWDGRLTGRWFGPERSIKETLVADPAIASRGEDQLDMFARAADGTLLHWSWDPHARHWVKHDPRGSGLVSDPVAISRSPGTIDVFARMADDVVLHGTWNGTQWDQSLLTLIEPPPPEVPWSADNAPGPAAIIRRPRDHVVLGLDWSGCDLLDEIPPKLAPNTGAARVVITFPPQHLAEEVAPGDGPLVPTVDPATTSGFPVWQARLARSSRVALVPPLIPIALTAEGILTALNGATVLPGSRDPNDGLTAIELPWGLIVSPENGTAAGEIHARHPSLPLELDSGTTGLWRTSLLPSDPATTLVLRALNPGGPDPFSVSLSQSSRLTIFAQTAPAYASRLELSALGGSLSAAGRWDNFEWDHEAALGRDQTVRILIKGILYPLGLRAEYVELTERIIDPTAVPPIAALRKQRILNVTEPIRHEDAADPALSRAFPFSEVEITTLTYTGLRDPDDQSSPDTLWRKHTRPALELVVLESRLEAMTEERTRHHNAVHGDMGWGGVGPVMEDLADENEDAAACLSLDEAIANLLDDIRALQELGGASEDVPVFFWPTGSDGSMIHFPVRLQTAGGDVHIALPLIFVQEWHLVDNLREPFHSLSDPAIIDQLDTEYSERKAGVVTLTGTPIDLVRSQRDPRPSGDVQEVHKLHLVSISRDGTFRPRLGRAVMGDRRNPDAWAFEVALPAMRALLRTDPAARVALAFAETYEQKGDAEDLAFQLAGEALDINFHGASDRSGGLVAPRISADTISRNFGLVNGMGAVSLDPAHLLSEGASLLGFELKLLVQQITQPPAIVTNLQPGQTPVVKMEWSDVPLRAFPDEMQPVFKPGRGGSTLTMSVVSSPSLNETRCVVQNFSLVMPPGADALLDLSFKSLTFTQTFGHAPKLDVDGVDAKFLGKLNLLQVLQDSVGLGAAGPKIDVSGTGITARYSLPVPPVGLLAFTMYNLVFNAGVAVPFTGEPVGVSIGFGSREHPFTLTVLALGGGGYIDLEIIHTGLRRLEISLEFGAAVSISVGIATAEVHAFGGIRFALQADGSVSLTGYVRLGGSVDLLGLVSVSIELRVELDYRFDTNQLVGRARMVIEIDLTLYSDSIPIDSGDWVIAGGDHHGIDAQGGGVIPEEEGLAVWTGYLGAFK